jgi:hypothetical protein
MRRLLLTGAALIALGTVPVGAEQKSGAVAGAYEAKAEQQIRCTRRGCRTLRPGCRTVRKETVWGP